MELLLALTSGMALGFLHAFDIDHIVAVSAFAGRTTNRWSAARMGAMWGLGHTAVLLLVGTILIVFRFSIPSIVQDWSEILVGVMLVALGVWTIRNVLRRKGIHIHQHGHDGTEHIHFHSHADDPGHAHGHSHSLLALGAVHGFAGTGSVVVMIPLAFADAWMSGIAFLVVFGIGSMLSMAASSLMLSAAVSRAGSGRLIGAAQGLAGIASFSVGVLWITGRFM